MTGEPAGLVSGPARYPVKPLAGEDLVEAEFGPRGLAASHELSTVLDRAVELRPEGDVPHHDTPRCT